MTRRFRRAIRSRGGTARLEVGVGRHTGPVERPSRRAGVDLELKGPRRLNGKGALQRRGPQPPGVHGMRLRRPTIYGEQLLCDLEQLIVELYSRG